MFDVSTAEISINRKDPGPNFDKAKAGHQVACFFRDLAERVVFKDLLKPKPVDSQRKKKTEEKIRKQVEFDIRFKTTKRFMKTWNHWRKFYLELDPIQPKNLQQVSTIENCIKFAKDNNLDLNILIACVHRAYQKMPVRPNFAVILRKGLELYNHNAEEVEADVERVDYEERAINRI